MQLPLALGDGELVSHDDAGAVVTRLKLGRTETALIRKLADRDNKLPDMYWQIYAELRARGFEAEVCAVGAWFVLGPERRSAGMQTQAQFARILGVSRYTVLRHIPKIKGLVQGYRMSWWGERVVHLDEATYRAALSDRSTAADRKLAYQVAAGAGVEVKIEPTGETGSNDYAELLAVAKQLQEAKDE